MTAILAYSDRFRARAGETLAFKVSRETPGPFTATIMKLTGPEAGPQGPDWAPVPVDRLSGTAPHQPTLAGSFAAVSAHPLFAGLRDLTLAAYVWPTTPTKGEQAIAGCWCAESGRGFQLAIDDDGRLEARVGDGRTIARATVDTPLPERRWMLAAMTLDTAAGTLTIRQWPVGEARFDTEVARSARTETKVRPDAQDLPFLMAASRAGDGGPTAPWSGIAGGAFYNGKIDRPRLSSRALDAAGIRALMADRIDADIRAGLVAAWDFSRGIPTETLRDSGPNRLDGCTVNLPARAMTGHNWTGETMAWTQRPEHYGAIHFHDDDLVDCNWQTVAEWTVPSDLASGVYCARFDADGFPFDVPFVVSPPVGVATNRVAFLASSATYTVYLNNRGRFVSPLTHLYHGRMIVLDDTDELMLRFPEIGVSTYDRHSDGSGVCYSSRHRPATNIRPTGRHWNFHCDLFIVHWLETLAADGAIDGYDVITDEDLHTHGLDLLRPYGVVLTGTHPEYDSTEMLDALDGYLRSGGRFMYMGGNGFYWRIAHHPTRAGVIEVRRPETGVRAWIAEPGEAHLGFTGEHGGLWRRQGRAPNALAGVGFISQGFDHCSYYRRQEGAADPRAAFVFAGVTDTVLGDFGLLQGGAAGLEIDSADTRLGTPPHALVLATSENHSNTYELVPEEVAIPHGASNAVQNRDVHADMVFFETPNGGAVWSSGSIAYAGSLSWNGYDNNIARLTTNVLVRFADPTPFEMPQ